MARRAVHKSLLRSAGVLVALVALANCGARTDLFVPSDEVFDASTEIEASIDGGPDSFVDDRSSVPDVIEEPVGCVPGTFLLSQATSELMFVIDRSRSMLFRLDRDELAEPGVITRWMALRSALNQVIIPFSGQIEMGARFFPVSGAEATSACTQDPLSAAIAPGLENARKIVDIFDETVPSGGTPSASALGLAAQQTSQRRAVARAIVIATDGAPNCNGALDFNTCVCTDPDTLPGTPCRGPSYNPSGNCLDDVDTIRVVKAIFDERRIPVFVVGIGVTGGFASTLDAMAVAGGRPRATSPRYFPAETPAELASAVTAVRDSVAKCSYVTPSAPFDPNLIDITINGVTIPRDPSHIAGWDWIDQEYGQLQLFGPACSLANPTNVNSTVLCERPDAAVRSDQ